MFRTIALTGFAALVAASTISLAPVAQAFSVFLVMWYLCYWLYKHKIFFKI